MRQNPKTEPRDPREIRMKKFRNAEPVERLNFCFLAFGLPSSFMNSEFGRALLQPPAEHRQSFVRSRDNLHANHLPYLRSRSRAGICRRFYRRHITTKKAGYITAADFFPADQRHVSRLEGRIACFQQRAKTFTFDHSDCLLGHKLVDG